jgi:hypothetical protein
MKLPLRGAVNTLFRQNKARFCSGHGASVQPLTHLTEDELVMKETGEQHSAILSIM